jgi:WD40 repeat protein
VLEEAPLQLYYAGLIFSPKTSVIREILSNEVPAWLLSGPKVAENWSPALQTLKGHSGVVSAVAFSPDGKTRLCSVANVSWVGGGSGRSDKC